MGFDFPAELGSDRLTFRRLLRVILPHLPRGSAFKRAVDPVGARWGPAEYILADIYDTTAAANWQRANEGAKSPSKRPAPYPRPGDELVKQTEQEKRAAAHLAMRERALAKEAEGGQG